MKDILTKAKNINIKEMAKILGCQFSNLYNTKKTATKEFYYLSIGVAYALENDVLFDTSDKIKIVCEKKPEALKYIKGKHIDNYIILTNASNLEMISFKDDMSDVVCLSNQKLCDVMKEMYR